MATAGVKTRDRNGRFSEQLPRTQQLGLAERITWSAEVFGSSAKLAEWLQVSPSTLSRWQSGKTTPDAARAQWIIDLDFIAARAATVWGSGALTPWLNGNNAFLGGATPLDMIRHGRTSEVVMALSAEGSEVYA
ncbi:helix-turn-helix transcriptional regulator [Leucobacter sp. OH1287]|uniref:helix-turn-helix domain-containing protein n=1 Tax=Leucobacter sp. OH1287 TaxID=2491049 RepID=UPI000F603AFE|nr:helix-turn-helix transcriptional regulator [Leucobacter sp. OH1287]RRD60498.1 hypothetical protein EII30_05890 [Leucobacter sp. OH1287]